MSIPDYRLTMRIKNNRILKRIEQAGYASVAAFCREHGIVYATIVSLVTMHRPPLSKKGKWTPSVIRLAKLLDCEPAELFNDRQLAADLETRVIEREIDEPILSIEDVSLKQIETDEEAVQGEYRDLVRRLLDKTELTDRERFVLMHRYGFDEAEWTLEELGEHFGLTREGIRRIERDAIRKMRGKAVRDLGLKQLHRVKLVPREGLATGGISGEWVPENDQPEPIKKHRDWRWD